MSTVTCYDIVVLGSGPGGQKAAIQGAKIGKHVAIIERERAVGGTCVHRGTIPSKTLRESALDVARLKRHAHVFEFQLRKELQVRTLMTRMNQVIEAHVAYISGQLDRNGINRFHGRAQFLSDRIVSVTAVDGSRQSLKADTIVIATGSVPRIGESIPIDHEHILDSDSILSMIYLPRSLTILGGGVIASEYASIFSLLGVKVTVIDQRARPLGFMDRELTDQFLQSFREHGGRYLGQETVKQVQWDGWSQVVTTLESGETVKSEKMLVALGRVANLADLKIEAAGLQATEGGLLSVDGYCRTSVPHIYAVGDVVGPPGLASSAMEQGRRAVRHATGIDLPSSPETIPIGIFTIPEMASVGITEKEAIERHGETMVGRARFDEVARGQIAGLKEGLLKMVADPEGKKLLGIQIVGEGATELIHVGQMGLLAKSQVDVFVENIFNFPTLAEAYRVAALDIVNRR